MKVVCIIQARLGSERLPNKVLLQVPPDSGVSMLERVIRKCLLATRVDEVVVVTPDVFLARICDLCRVDCYVKKWPERDVLREYVAAATATKADIIVRVTADCPLIEPEIIDGCVEEYLKNNADLIYNTDETMGQVAGEGSDVEVLGANILAFANLSASPTEREHVTGWVRRLCNCRQVNILRTGVRSINTPEDYEWLCDYLKKSGA